MWQDYYINFSLFLLTRIISYQIIGDGGSISLLDRYIGISTYISNSCIINLVNTPYRDRYAQVFFLLYIYIVLYGCIFLYFF